MGFRRIALVCFQQKEREYHNNNTYVRKYIGGILQHYDTVKSIDNSRVSQYEICNCKRTDTHGKEVKFDNCVIVMTTNAGSTGVSNTAGFGNSTSVIAESRTEKALLEFLRPEFINRVDEIITFRGLEIADFESIAKIMLGDLSRALWDKGIILRYSDRVPQFVAEKSFSPKYGARNMRRYISREIEDMFRQNLTVMLQMFAHYEGEYPDEIYRAFRALFGK